MASLADYQADLARLTELSDEELNALQDNLIAAFDEADQGDGDDAALQELADALDTVRTELQGRGGEEEAPAAEESPIPEAASADPAVLTLPTPPEVAPPVEEDARSSTTVTAPPGTVTTIETKASTPTTTSEGTAVAASSTAVVPREAEPVVASAASVVLAGSDIPGFNTGQPLTSLTQYAQAMTTRINQLGRLGGGDGEHVIVASVRSDAPEDRTLDFGDPDKAWDKIRAVTDMDAIVASGGCCAPLTTRYELFDCGGDSSRPVRDSLAGFRADRGGIRFSKGPELADLNAGVGFWTCADDADVDLADELTWKKCARIECPPEETAEIQAVTLCLTFGVMQSRVYPELVTANTKLALVAHARLAEAALLAQIKAGSTAVADGGTGWGAIRDLLDTVGRAAMYYRDRYRIGQAKLRAIIPSWVKELLRGDIIAGPDYGDLRGHFGISDAEIEGFFKDRGINVTWALDSADPATGGGTFPALTTALPAWPTSVQWALFVEGTWLLLDGGSLDLGIVRDSTLVRTNDYQQFSEIFESAAHIGCESLWVTSAVNVSGCFASGKPCV